MQIQVDLTLTLAGWLVAESIGDKVENQLMIITSLQLRHTNTWRSYNDIDVKLNLYGSYNSSVITTLDDITWPTDLMQLNRRYLEERSEEPCYSRH